MNTCKCGHDEKAHVADGLPYCTYTDSDGVYCECFRFEKIAYPFLLPAFLEAMNDIGRYGHEKYGDQSFHHRASVGDNSRGESERTTSNAIAAHSAEHFQMYLRGELHDHFNTQIHQIAAVAFNAMMEAFFAGVAK